MARRKRENLYNTSYDRISIYPSYRKSESRDRIDVGSVITVRVSMTDENGEPLGRYRGYKVVITGDYMPGDMVKVRITRVKGNTLWGEPVE